MNPSFTPDSHVMLPIARRYYTCTTTVEASIGPDRRATQALPVTPWPCCILDIGIRTFDCDFPHEDEDGTSS